MIQHTQRDTGHPYGSCLATCFASVLDLPLEAVPNFILFQHSWEAIKLWSAERRLVYHFSGQVGTDEPVRCFSDECGNAPRPSSGLVVAGGMSPRETPDGMAMGHAVVWDLDAGRCAWDPHPSRAGLDGPPLRFYWFTPAPEGARYVFGQAVRLAPAEVLP